MSTSSRTKRFATANEADARWTAIVARHPHADGKFYYAVKTTGIYCRPTCGARLAQPEHVSFYSTCEEAEAEGFRPCRRCQPNQTALHEKHVTIIADACRRIAAADTTPALAQLAQQSGLSVSHFHRIFKAHTGLTPKDYAEANHAQRVRKALASSETITEAIYEAGYNSTGRFYENANNILGMTPTSYRAGGSQTNIHYAVTECSLGMLLVALSERGVCAILLGDDAHELTRDLQKMFSRARLVIGDGNFEQLVLKVLDSVETPARGLNLPLDLRGTAFQQRVWQALRQIPAGSTASYAEIAANIGQPKAVRAVARACGANRLSVAIPCHRVVRTDGALSGYRWGVERKRELLARERKS